jgi:NhaP-type Na+/H+ or K+/H+ antiporter
MMPGPVDLDTALLVFGALLALGAVLSGVARRSFLSLTALFVVAGFVLGDGGLDVLHFAPESAFVASLATVSLVVILFRDGVEVDRELLTTAWHLPARKLVLAMPLTAAIVAVIAKLVTDLTWQEAALLGALLSPTDPVLSHAVVTNPKVPRTIRHSLNLESGLNDGLALTGVLVFLSALSGASDFVWWRFLLQDVGIGLATGVVVGLAGALLMPRPKGLASGIPEHQKSLFGLGVAFAAYGIALAPPHGNGFIAVFVAAITLGVRRPDIRAAVEHRADDIVELVKLTVFVVFGAILTVDILFQDGWAAVAIVAVLFLVARPVAVALALVGTRTDRATWAFMSWFGPKGVATMAFSLLILAEHIAAGQRIFGIAALAVLTSAIAHGLTDTPGVDWLARRTASR